MKRALYSTAVVFCFGIARAAAQDPVSLTRHYSAGETVSYEMHGVNQSHQRTVRYEARADGVVKRDASQTFFEEFVWSNLRVNGEPFTLSPASQEFKETLSFSPDYKLSIPDLSKVQPILIGPITDLLAFYADVQLSMQQKSLLRPGDHILVKHGTPNSWADGTYILFGQDAVDFDITLQSVDKTARTAMLVVRHVPPAENQIKWPAQWMLNPVTASPNNWSEVEKASNGKYAAQVGSETFQADIKISISDGRIISAFMENPVTVLERDCDDAALTVCASPTRYGIKREISIQAVTKRP